MNATLRLAASNSRRRYSQWWVVGATAATVCLATVGAVVIPRVIAPDEVQNVTAATPAPEWQLPQLSFVGDLGDALGTSAVETDTQDISSAIINERANSLSQLQQGLDLETASGFAGQWPDVGSEILHVWWSTAAAPPERLSQEAQVTVHEAPTDQATLEAEIARLGLADQPGVYSAAARIDGQGISVTVMSESFDNSRAEEWDLSTSIPLVIYAATVANRTSPITQ